MTHRRFNLFARQRWAWGALLLLAGAGLGWMLSDRPPAPQGETVSAPARPATASPSVPSASAPTAWTLLAAAEQATRAAIPPKPKLKTRMSDADWLAYDRQWCAALQPLRESLQASPDLHPLLMAAWMPSEDDSRRMADLLTQRAQQVLQAKGDVASQAVGLWWRATLVPPHDFSALHALAESTRDPLALALAHRKDGPARLGLLWRDTEPQNLAAIWAAQTHEKLPIEELLARVAQATRNDNGLPEAFRRLDATAPPHGGGFVAVMHQTWAVGVYSAEALPSQALAMTQACSRSRDPALLAACERAAERMWALGPNDVMGALTVLSMVRAHSGRSPAWDARARQVEAMWQMEADDAQAALHAMPRALACMPSPVTQALTRERLIQDAWAWWQARLPQDPQALLTLSERYRQGNKGKGLLAPRP
ncbi:hypothetical protein [Inhella crocodyli]|uniref:Uncharacterized protein n=1 Tax=Inhella crocodyli TaxID=2499851 RepID=A0A3S2URW3_9BURK|nr:hypothetical protein [Inhella crocodyli]RVT82941.1 hypothetical protein EOD73_15355 [Inhella crocodyli]